MCVLTAMGIGCVLPASAQITTTTSLKASPAAAKLGQVVTLQASVSPYPNAGIADRVTFYDGVSILGSAGVSKQGGQGVALFDALLPAGNHMLYAYYSGRPTVLTPSKSVNKVTVQVSAVPSAMYRAFDAGPSEKNKLVIVADMSGNGSLDIVSGGDRGFNVIHGDGKGNFPVRFQVPSSNNSPPPFPNCIPEGLAVGDLDQDGLLDVVMACNGSVFIFKGLPGGQFDTLAGHASSFYVGLSNMISPVIADFNGDGIADIAIAGKGIYYGTGSNFGFTAPSKSVATSSATKMIAVDLNLDGHPDLAWISGNTVFALVSNGPGGSFLAPVMLSGSAPFSDLVWADFDGDQNPDLAAVSPTGHLVSVWLGDGKGGFLPRKDLAAQVGSSPQAIGVGDFDGDGNLDLVVSQQSSPFFEILRGDGAGGFQGGFIYMGGSSDSSAIAVGDLNGDGRADIVMARAVYGLPAVVVDLALGAAKMIASPFYNAQSAQVAKPFATALGVQVMDSNNLPMNGVYVTFAAPAAGPSAILTAPLNSSPGTVPSGTIFATGGSGQAGVSAAANKIANIFPANYQVLASLAGVAPVKFQLANLIGPPASVVATSGGGQSQTVGKQFANPLVAAVVDAYGNVVPIQVSFSAPSTPAATFSNIKTDAAGFTSAQATADKVAGTYNVRASYQSLPPATFTLTNNPDSAASIAATGGTPQSTTPGANFPQQLQAEVQDKYGNGVPGKTVTFDSGGAGTFQGSVSVITGPNGIAIAPVLKAGLAVGSFNGTAKSTGAGATAKFDLLVAGTTTVTLTGSPLGTANFGQQVTLTATLTPSAASGTVNFYDVSTTVAGTWIGAGPISAGVATFKTILLDPGSHQFRARFPATGQYLGATSTTVLLTVTGVPGVSFLPPKKAGTGTLGGSVAASADFDGDGKADLVVLSTNADTLAVLLGDGVGGFKTVASVNLAGNGQTKDVVVADVNGDGKADILVSHLNSNGLDVLLGNGNGSFQTAIFTKGNFSVLAVGDFDNDGIPDVVTTDSNRAILWTGQGNGKFKAGTPMPIGSSSTAILAGDFNNDGNLDIATANPSSGNVTILLGNGDGTFALGLDYKVGVGNNPSNMVAGRFRGAGSPLDLAMVDEGKGTVTILLGDGNGAFQAGGTFPVGATSSPEGIAAGDFNGDGILDLAISDDKTKAIMVLLGNGDGTFQAPLAYFAGVWSEKTVVADFNGDGRADLAVGSQLNGSVAVLLSAVPANVAATTGTPQSKPIKTAFAPLGVKVTDANGIALANVPVAFQPPVSGAGAVVIPAFPRTGNGLSGTTLGLITAAATANSTAGSYLVNAAVNGIAPAPFSLTNMSGPAASIAATIGTPQTSPINTAFPLALQATVLDASSNPVSDATVTFTAPAGSGTFPGNLLIVTAKTNASGVAASPVFTAGLTPATYTVTALTSGVTTPANFILAVTAPVTIDSVRSFTLAAFPASFTVSGVGCNPGTYTTPKTFNWASGLNCTVLFANVTGALKTIYQPGPTNSLWTDGNSTNPRTIAVSNLAAAYTVNYHPQHEFCTQSNPAGGGTFSYYTVTNTTACLNIWESYPGFPTYSVTPTPTPGYIFSSWSGDGSGNTVPLVVVHNAPRTIIGNFILPASITATGGATQSTLVSTQFGQPLQVTVLDAGNKPVSGAPVTFAVTPAVNGASAALSATTVTTNGSGVASITATANATAGGPYVVSAKVFGLTTFATFNLTNSPNTAGISLQSNYADALFSVAVNGTTTPYTGNSGLLTVNGNDSVVFSHPASPQTPNAGTRYYFYGWNGFSTDPLTLTTPIGSAAFGTTFLAGYKLTIIGTAIASPSSSDGFYTQTASTFAPVTVTGTCPGGLTPTGLQVSTGGYYPVNSGVFLPASGPVTMANGATITMQGPKTVTVVCPTAGSISVTGGATQNTLVSTQFAQPLQVTVRDTNNNLLSGAAVTFTVTPAANGASATLSSGTVITNPSGLASITATANATMGSYVVQANVFSLPAVNFSLTNVGATCSTVVNSTVDAVDVSPGDGICSDNSGRCTLRAAIMEANALPCITTITLPAGVYALTIPGTHEDLAATGDLDITGNLTINGAGAATTIVDGGGIDRVFEVRPGATAKISAVTIRNGNNSDSDSNQYGGGIFNQGTMTLENSTVSGNSATSGGGIVNLNGRLAISGSNISNNQTGFYAGGIFNYSAVLTMTNSTVSGNTADSYRGGGIVNLVGTATLTNSTVSGNISKVAGAGGIWNWQGGSVLTLINSTVSGNTGNGEGYAGGVLNDGGTAIFVSSTVAGNKDTSATGGGISHVTGSTTTIKNTIIANNTSGATNKPADCFGSITSLNRNLASDNSCGLSGTGDMNNTNPMLSPLASNGGPTMTHALLSGSPAINSVPIADCKDSTGAPLATDQRGISRPQGTACDIGAYEALLPGSITATGGTPQSTLVSTVFAQPLQVTVRDTNNNLLQGAVVTFTVTPASNGASATLSSGTATTNLSGVAFITATANGTAGGPYTVSAKVFGLTTFATFNLTNSPNTASISLQSNYADALFSITVNGTKTNYTGNSGSLTVNGNDSVVFSHPASPQTANASTRYYFYGWNGFSTDPLTLATPIGSAAFGATFLASYKLTIIGTAIASPSSSDGFYTQTVSTFAPVTVTGSCPGGLTPMGLQVSTDGYYPVNSSVFLPLSGPVTMANGATITMQGPKTVTVVCPTPLAEIKLSRSGTRVFGSAIGIDGMSMVIGSPGESNGGAAYVYHLQSGVWSMVQRLTGNDTISNGQFGSSVAITGTTIVVGSYGAGGKGAAYVFNFVANTWNQVQKIAADDGVAGDQFGVSATMTASTLVIGANTTNSGRGSAYVFELAGVWTQVRKLTASDGVAHANFGQAVAISGTTVAVGAAQANTAYIFERAGGAWNETQKLTRAVGPLDEFGFALALDGTRLLVGAPSANSTDGAVYVFESTGGIWSQVQKMAASDPASSDNFGYSVALSGTNAVLGAASASQYRGKAYVFKLASGTWAQSYKLVASDIAPDFAYGYPVVVTPDTIVIGASGANNAAGAVYVYGIQ